MSKDGHRYYLTLLDGPEREVTRGDFIEAERSAGFYSKFGPDHPATGGFSNGTISGRSEVVDIGAALEETKRVLREDGVL